MQAMLWAVAAGLCWGIGEVCTKAVLHGQRIGPFGALAVRATVALPVLWLGYFAAVHCVGSEPRPQWRALTAADLWRLVVGAGLGAGALALVCFYLALSLGEVSRVKPVAFAIAPAAAVLLGWWWLGEPLTARKLAGVALVLAGVAVLATAPAAPPAR